MEWDALYEDEDQALLTLANAEDEMVGALVIDALEDAEDRDEFLEKGIGYIQELIDSAKTVQDAFRERLSTVRDPAGMDADGE